MSPIDASVFTEALSGALVRADENGALTLEAGPVAAQLLTAASLPYIHDRYPSRRSIVDRLTLGDPPVFGENIRRLSIVEAHAVVDVIDRIVDEHYALIDAEEAHRPHAPGEITSKTVEVRVEAAALAQHATKVVELLEQGILVRLVEGDRVIANVMPVR